ncbi:endolytic transglycosylase MltG [Amycolatopsis alkalitolerans]|uniref:Endolytic murein transglycosylase n=1 Tax=Amycolatopsis alkalitolerans TaxID=2547244 RepID=A0A5C4M5K6_9PSEU|nr:endolytic transglycosylase MltG [Amycolatopsis alkalitolerans]TNC27020.1 endolytic transglycosylase MltG [Amycolatopsis alkalitolerans]
MRRPGPDHGLDLFNERQPPPRRRPRQIPPDETPTEVIPFEDVEYYEDEYADDEYAEDDDYEEDYDDERAEPEYIEPPDGPDEPPRRAKRGRRMFRWVAALAVIALIGGGAWFGIEKIFGYADYQGSGDSDVIIEIGDGDSTNAIGAELTKTDVVASAKAFVKASEGNAKVLSLQPGYYVMKTKMSGAAAVAKLTTPDARVGVLQVRAGTQLDDVTQPDGTLTPGVFTLLSKASCAQLNGQSTCISVDDLRKVAASADLKAMGVPDWAANVAAKSTDPRRIEGLVAPGVYDVKPGWTADQLLGFVLKNSATTIQAAGLTAASTVAGQNPYQVLVIASLIEREGVKQDFEKISRVIYNRLAVAMRLQLDSTVNYLLDKPVVTTTDADRARPDPYNTYSVAGLPPTPIGSPSAAAIQAALQPADGNWMYFVKCEKNGLSCFASTQAEHNQNVALARQRGAY